MTLSELRTLTSVWLDDLQFGYFSAAQIDVWLNNALQEAQKLLIDAGQNYYIACPVVTSLVINQREYVLPIDFKKLHRLEVIVSGTTPNEDVVPLQPITLNQQDLVPNKTGQPAFYYVKKNRLVLYPAPDTTLNLRLYYSYRVADMTLDTDEPDLPEEYHEYIAIKATLDGFLRDGRDPGAFLAKLSDYEDKMKMAANERLQDQPRQIVETGSDSVGYFYY